MHSFAILPWLLGYVGLLLRKLFKELPSACSQGVELDHQAGQGDAWARLHTAICRWLLLERAAMDPLGIPLVSYPSKQSQPCPSANTDVSSWEKPPDHSSFSWSLQVFIPMVFPPLVLSFSNPIPALSLTALHPHLLSLLILSFLPSSAHWSAYSSCFYQPQSSFSLSATLLSLHFNQLLSLSFVNTGLRMRGRKRSLKRI